MKTEWEETVDWYLDGGWAEYKRTHYEQLIVIWIDMGSNVIVLYPTDTWELYT